MLGKLPLTVPLQPSETAISFASRLAARNGAQNVSEFCLDLGLRRSALQTGNQNQVRRLAELGGCDASLLAYHTPRLITAGRYELYGNAVQIAPGFQSHLRYCPKCVQVDYAADPLYGGYERSMYALHAVRVCQEHSVLLRHLPAREDLPFCKEPHSRYRRLFEGTDIGPSNLVKQEDRAMEHYLLQRLKGQKQASWLDQMPLGVATSFCENFGALLAFGSSRKRGEMTDADWTHAGATGFSVLRHGEAAFFDAVDQAFTKHGNLESRQYRVCLGPFFQWLRDRSQRKEYDFLRDLMREHIVSNYPIALETKVLGEYCGESRLHTVGTAASRFGVTKQSMGRRMVEMGYAEPQNDNGSFRLLRYIPADIAKAAADEIKEFIDLVDAASQIGLDRNIFAALVKFKVFRPAITLDGALPKFDPHHVDAVWRGCLGQKVRWHETIGEFVRLDSAYLLSGCRAEILIALIAQKKVASYHSDYGRNGLRSILVSPSEIRNVLRVPEHVGLPNRAAANRLKVSQNLLNELVRKEVLRRSQIGWPIAQRKIGVIELTSILEFEAEYISLADLAKANGNMPGPLSQKLAAKGVLPVFQWKKGTRFYRRSEVA
ncbi:TniQ family protein [uncultured Martelella sp.]|uniref:TniQ family protein n=1 Tax=uncultured Martelella sp. TaxID=392331 RepID=UPI0029C8BDFD|nr:TniQ family protein [uncultured Martelella sp.]